MTSVARIRTLFVATATIFFTRALLFSTWQDRGPEVEHLLHLNTSQMGLLSMLYPLGGLTGLLNANYLNSRFGSRKVTIVGFSSAAAALVGLAFTVPAGNVWLSAALLVTIGFPMGAADFVGNFEGNDLDRQSSRSLVPGIHAVFGVGMFGAAGLSSLLSLRGITVSNNYLIVAVLVALPSIWAGLTFPKRKPSIESAESKLVHRAITRRVWREPLTWMVAAIAFTFAIAELSAGTWVPLALTTDGFSVAAASAAFGFFWVAVTAGRAIGGWTVDRFGLRRTLLGSAIVTAAGVTLFIANSSLHLPYVALTLWGLGMANGIPLAINNFSSSDEAAPARINLIIIVCYTGMLVVGPALGALGQLVGIQLAFSMPVVLLAVAAFLTRVVRR